MEHPEKELFEEVKQLRSEMNELRDRIFKLEADYIESIESLEVRELKYSRLDSKLHKYKSSLLNTKTILLDDKSIPLKENTLEENIYISPRLKSLSCKTPTPLEIDSKYLFAILEIIQKGHSIYSLEEEPSDLRLSLDDESLLKDSIFLNLLKEYFDSKSLCRIYIDFNLNHISLPPENSVKGLMIEGTTVYLTSTECVLDTKEANSLLDVKSNKAVFIDYNASVKIELENTLRSNCLWVRPYKENSSIWSPLNGTTYTRVFVSRDGNDWKKFGNIPSDYGSKAEDGYVSKLSANRFYTFRFVKFSTGGECQFSVSFISFEEPSKIRRSK